ncbi:voltage-dependent calcium channel subunit alpha-2/delta-3-like protein [Lates japonicus]|uniref:Voltage-dependent calcium channel subunit alpha-2/delta-3-like protein n=1 Tax=Lates japonicus TaxID=270547 RepID=A0AAD3NKE9_LATJO|nr:voltage-dependent calcium channel subunit alpha-2/delta-3-like protein [Lates japonicus]
MQKDRRRPDTCHPFHPEENSMECGGAAGLTPSLAATLLCILLALFPRNLPNFNPPPTKPLAQSASRRPLCCGLHVNTKVPVVSNGTCFISISFSTSQLTSSANLPPHNPTSSSTDKMSYGKVRSVCAQKPDLGKQSSLWGDATVAAPVATSWSCLDQRRKIHVDKLGLTYNPRPSKATDSKTQQASETSMKVFYEQAPTFLPNDPMRCCCLWWEGTPERGVTDHWDTMPSRAPAVQNTPIHPHLHYL